MSEEKETAEDEAIGEVYGLIDKALPSSVTTILKKLGINIDSWWMAEEIMGISQRYVERKIEESNNGKVL